MAKAKSPADWTPAYRKRMEKAFEKNPFVTKTEARRGVNSKEARAERTTDGGYDWLDNSLQSVKNRKSNVKLREELGVISPTQARVVNRTLDEISELLKKKMNVIAGSRKDIQLTNQIAKRYNNLQKKGIVPQRNKGTTDNVIYYHGGF